MEKHRTYHRRRGGTVDARSSTADSQFTEPRLTIPTIEITLPFVHDCFSAFLSYFNDIPWAFYLHSLFNYFKHLLYPTPCVRIDTENAVEEKMIIAAGVSVL